MSYITINEINNIIDHYNPSKIYLDADGVLLQSISAMVELIKDKHNLDLKPHEVIDWNFHHSLSSKQIEELFSDEKFFDIVEFYDGVLEFIKQHIDKITVVTKGQPRNLELKGLLFAKHGLGDMKYIGLPLNKSKGCVDMSKGLFIDDCVNNLNESNAKIKILFREYENDASWQLGWNGLEMKSWI